MTSVLLVPLVVITPRGWCRWASGPRWPGRGQVPTVLDVLVPAVVTVGVWYEADPQPSV